MNKKYIISESQLKNLIEKKKRDKMVSEKINNEINRYRLQLNESQTINEGIIDTIKNYMKKGLLTVSVISSLLANNVSAQTLADAGVPKDKIEMAQNKTTNTDNSNVERQLERELNRRGEVGTLNSYKSLSQEEKNNVLSAISNSGQNIKDIDISLYLNKSNELKGDNYTQIGSESTITVDTLHVDLVKDLKTDFKFNSAEIENPEEMRTTIQNLLNSFHTIDEVIIKASSSTLRNTGDFEGMTWEESSLARVNALKQVMNGLEYDLGGCGKNKKNTISSDSIKVDVSGENGDGTSGAKSPMEVSQEAISWYKQKGVDSVYWKSNSKQEPTVTMGDIKTNPKEALKEYSKNQYVKIIIKGQVVKTVTNEIVNYNYLKIDAKNKGYNIIPTSKQGIQGTKVLACPIPK